MDPNLNTPTVAPPQPQPQPKKSKLGLILGLSIGGGILIIGIIVTVLLLVLGGVSRQDYRDAQEVASDMVSSYNKIGSIYISTSSTQTQINNELDTLKTNLKSFNENYDKLGETKAVKNDKKAAELYKTLTDKKSAFNSTMDISIEVYEKIFPVMSELSDYSSSYNYNDRVKSRQTKLATISGLKVQLNKDLISELSDLLTKMAPVAQRMQTNQDGDYTQYDPKASSEWSDLTSQWSDVITDWQSNFLKQTENAELKDPINKLNEYLTDKASGLNE
jgi:Zn-dependent oligopeptidase